MLRRTSRLPQVKRRLAPRRKAGTPVLRSRPQAHRVTIGSATAETTIPGTQPSRGDSRALTELANQIKVCVRCPLHASRTNAVPGEGSASARVMVIGEAPGGKEDKTGLPFVGSAGRYLDHVLEGTGLTRQDFFITNVVKCRPPSNRTPKADEVQTCTSLYLFVQMRLINPRIVLLLGRVAVRRVLDVKTVEEARGKVIERDGRKYIASYHPAVRFYREDLAAAIKEDFGLLRRELLALHLHSPA